MPISQILQRDRAGSRIDEAKNMAENIYVLAFFRNLNTYIRGLRAAGGAFRLVSCPHYLAEMIIYFGLALVLDIRRPLSWLPLVWVV